MFNMYRAAPFIYPAFALKKRLDLCLRLSLPSKRVSTKIKQYEKCFANCCPEFIDDVWFRNPTGIRKDPSKLQLNLPKADCEKTPHPLMFECLVVHYDNQPQHFAITVSFHAAMSIKHDHCLDSWYGLFKVQELYMVQKSQ